MESGFLTCRLGILLPGWMAFFLGPYPFSSRAQTTHAPSEQNELCFSLWRKGKFVLFWRLATEVEGDLCPKANCSLLIRGHELLKGSFRGAQADGGAYMQKQQ